MIDLNDFASVVLPDRVYFGCMPNQQQLELLKEQKFKYIINVMSDAEKNRFTYPLSPSTLSMHLLVFPLPDQRVPLHAQHFLRWIAYLGNIVVKMNTHEKMYIHCRGGHGRSGLVAGCLLYWYWKIHCSKALTGEECIQKLTTAHCQRKILNPKYLVQNCPVAKCQQQFLKSLEKFEKLWVK